MASFTIGKPVESETAAIEVTVGPGSPLPVGQHAFQLVVVDDAGNKSVPAQVSVTVKDMKAPTAILKAPSQVPFGQSFELDGHESTDAAPGQIVKYIWTMVS
jgi:hypothetical protein